MTPMLSSLFQDKKERTDFFIAIAVVALFGIFICYHILGDASVDDYALETALSSNPDAEVITPVLASDEEISLAPKTNNKSNQVEQDNESTNAAPSIYVIDSTEVEIVSPSITTVDLSTTEVPIQNTQEDVKTNEEVIPAESSSTLVDSIVVNPITPSITKPTITTDKERDCRIIVGSYRLQSSRDEMLNILTNAEYDVVSYREKGLNIVAIRHSCDKDKLRSTVNTVRKEFAKGAFITSK